MWRTLVSSAVLLGVWALGWPRAAFGDGGVFITEVAEVTQESAASEGLVSSNGQRAAFVQWSPGADWELYVEPGTLRAAGAAWVLPLPVVPEVSAASAAFIDELDAATLPVITETVRYEVETSGWGCGIEGDTTEESGVETSEAAAVPPVTVWGAGRLGDAGYEILSALDPGSLEEWLATHGYVVPDGLGERARPYVEDGYVFVAVHLVRADGAPEHLPTFRFRLPGRETIEYPLRLTALSVGHVPGVLPMGRDAAGCGPDVPRRQLLALARRLPRSGLRVGSHPRVRSRASRHLRGAVGRGPG